MKQLIIAVAIGIFAASGLPVASAAEVGVSATFSDADIRIISAWYKDQQSTNKGRPAKGKRNGLPPGIAKNLERGKSLPPGIAKQYLPEGLNHKLSKPPTGYERIIVGGKILLIEVATQVIHDVLTDMILY